VQTTPIFTASNVLPELPRAVAPVEQRGG